MKLKSQLAILATALTAAFVPPAGAQDLKDGKATLKTGNWTVLRSVNPMTDKVMCIGIYKANYGVQLAEDKLFVSILGGIRTVTLRFGEDPPQSLRPAQEMEKKVDAVIVQGSEFRQALETTRLRVQVLTLVRGVATDDFDIAGIQAAVNHIQAGCPEMEVPAATKSSPPVSACSDVLIARLRAARVTEQQITSACRQ